MTVLEKMASRLIRIYIVEDPFKKRLFFTSKRKAFRQRSIWKREYKKSFIFYIEFKLSKAGILDLLQRYASLTYFYQGTKLGEGLVVHLSEPVEPNSPANIAQRTNPRPFESL